MPTIQFQPSRAQEGNSRISVERKTAKETRLDIGRNQLLIWQTIPVAVVTGSVVYFYHDSQAAITRAVNRFYESLPHVRCSAPDFDFIVGQVLTSAGLPLTRREG